MSIQNYWKSFYKNIHNLNFPSQFASYIISYKTKFNYDQILDIGCGNGRDSIFFLKYFDYVYSCDQVISFENNFINSLECDISELSVNKLKINIKKNKFIYSRFFIHAIDEREQMYFFDFIKSISISKDLLFLEYRNQDDKNLPKITSDHYRRYINDDEIIRKIIDLGFKQIYRHSGTGIADFIDNSPSVTRLVFIYD